MMKVCIFEFVHVHTYMRIFYADLTHFTSVG